MKAIETWQRGRNRMFATDLDGNTAAISRDDKLTMEENCADAAKALCVKMGWHGMLVGGHTGKGMVWVWADHLHPLNYFKV